jgi:hypothetical protein
MKSIKPFRASMPIYFDSWTFISCNFDLNWFLNFDTSSIKPSIALIKPNQSLIMSLNLLMLLILIKLTFNFTIFFLLVLKLINAFAT